MPVHGNLLFIFEILDVWEWKKKKRIIIVVYNIVVRASRMIFFVSYHSHRRMSVEIQRRMVVVQIVFDRNVFPVVTVSVVPRTL